MAGTKRARHVPVSGSHTVVAHYKAGQPKPASMPTIMAKCQPSGPMATARRFGKPLQPVRECRPLYMTTHRRCSLLVTHFSSNGLDSACGRSSQTLVSTAVTEDVSCKSCQRSLSKPEAASSAKPKAPSLAELRKTAKAAAPAVAAAHKPAAKVVSTAPAAAKPANVAEQQPARSSGFSVKSAWAARLAEQGDRCRLPRGKARQRHV